MTKGDEGRADSVALSLTIVDGKITEMDVVANPERLARLDLAVLAD